MIDYATILTRRHPERKWVINADDYEQLVMLDGGEKPTKKLLDDVWPEVKAEIEAEYAQRKSAQASALQKLKELGLTDAEIAAVVG